jgi:hypothetical protein
MFVPQVHKIVGKVCALVATTLIIPALAYADCDGHRCKDNDHRGNNNRYGVRSVPDGGPGIVLLTTAIGAVLLFSAIQRSRAKI